MEKISLRKEARRRMLEISDEYASRAGRRMAEMVLDLTETRQAKTIFVFASAGKEPDSFMLIQKLLDAEKTVCLPKCLEKGRMEARQIKNILELSPGAYNIPEPSPDDVCISPQEIDVAILPCLMAGRDGSRLGHGGGYYDRFLSGFSGKKILLCLEALLSDEIPMDPHDVYADVVVTEKNIFRKTVL